MQLIPLLLKNLLSNFYCLLNKHETQYEKESLRSLFLWLFFINQIIYIFYQDYREIHRDTLQIDAVQYFFVLFHKTRLR